MKFFFASILWLLLAGFFTGINAQTNTRLGIDALPAGVGTHNTALGYFSLNRNTTGRNNTATGSLSLRFNTTGTSNTATGVYALYFNTTGIWNTANGVQALYANTTGNYNTGSGVYALFSNSSGNFNTATGLSALYANTTGAENTATGVQTLFSNTSGVWNTATGVNVLYANTTGHSNTGHGRQALFSNTTGVFNTATGVNALFANTTGAENTATGVFALFSNTSGVWNTANGFNALYSNTTGNANTGHGRQALFSNTTGILNTANGLQALYSNTIGNFNTGNGFNALYSNTEGYGNTATGVSALASNTTGFGNTAIGFAAGNYSEPNSNFSNATFLGAQTGVNAAGLTNITAVGFTAINTASNQLMLGNTSVTSVRAAGSFVVYSDGRFKNSIKEDVPGLNFINKLRPVTYHYGIQGLNKHIQPATTKAGMPANDQSQQQETQEQKQIEEAIKSKEKKVYTGFIAQEVEQAAKKLNYDFSGVHVPENEKDVYGLSYSEFVVPLVKAVQELSKQNEDLQKQIDELKSLILSKPNSNSTVTGANPEHMDANLEQNIPNPATNSTRINYTLPQKYTSAQIIFTDMTGKTLKQIKISGTGKGTLDVDLAFMAAGIYHYSFIIDGRLIATKKMLLDN
jgi:trimeric autotransporter adhesin